MGPLLSLFCTKVIALWPNEFTAHNKPQGFAIKKNPMFKLKYYMKRLCSRLSFEKSQNILNINLKK